MTPGPAGAVRLWRIAPGRHAPLDGEGARRFGGRWSSPGQPAIYLASQLALAALEVLAHLDPAALPIDLAAFAVDVPAALGAPEEWSRWDAQRTADGAALVLPDGWRDVAQPVACRAVGDAWLRSASDARAALLRVPSAVLPAWAEPAGGGVTAGSWCAVLDARHPAARDVRVAERHPFAFDPRLLAVRPG